MTTSSIQTTKGGQGFLQGTMRALTTISGAMALSAVLVGGVAGVAQAADSNDRIVPPSPAEVAMLRSLLALQHPALRSSSTVAVTPVATVPTVGTEPARRAGQSS